MKFVIIHGAFGAPEGNWFPQLKEKLESLGQEVISPQFPVEDIKEIEESGPSYIPKQQILTNWLKTFEEEVLPNTRNQKTCLIGHSLGPVFILHAVSKFHLSLDCAIFVSPFMTSLNIPNDWQFELVNKSFFKSDFDFPLLQKLIPVSYVLYSESDPYVDKKFPKEFAQKLNSSIIEVRNAGHLNSEVNLNEFPLVLELCKTRLDLSLYQKYLAHRRELYSVDYKKGKSEELIYLPPKEVFDEGVFHFRNLKKGGFCTLFTGTSFWDAQSVYMTEARKAAKFTMNLIRVYLIENLKDLKRKALLNQIRLDIESDVQVYFCLLRNINQKIKEPDFGIWDDEYVCFVRFDNMKKAKEVVLSSRQKDIKEALAWKEQILKVATKITDADKQVQEFIKSKSKRE